MRKASPPTGSEREGFSIVELLCVIAVIAIVISLIGPAVVRARESARRIDCSSRLRQIGVALLSHEDSHKALPAGWTVEASGQSAYGWTVPLLPWIEQRSLADTIVRNRALSDPANSFALAQTIPLAFCPSDPLENSFSLYAEGDEGHDGYGQESEEVLIVLPSASYVGIFGTHDPDDGSGGRGEGPFLCREATRLSQFERGLSQTMLVSERTARKLPSTWIGFLTAGEDAAARVVGYADLGPNRDDADECELDSRHPGQINVLWGDGRVDPVSNSIDGRVYRAQARLRQGVEQ